MTRKDKWIQAFAVVRRDQFPGHDQDPDDSSPRSICGGEYSFTVKEVVLDCQVAIQEAERLNALHGGDSVRYFWEATHLFVDGGSHGTEGGDARAC